MKIFTAWVLGALGAVVLGAQEPPPALPSDSFGTAIDVRVINVEAVVTDAGDHRVHGLAAGDLVLEVDGREVPIEYFSEMASGKAVAPTPKPGEAPQAAAAPSPAPEGRSLLVFIDDLFATAQQRNEVLQGLERDLSLLGPADRMAIIASSGERMDVLSNWTGDRAALAAALQAARQRPAQGNFILASRRSDQDEEDLIREAMASTDPDGNGGATTNEIGGPQAPAPFAVAKPHLSDPPTYSRLIRISNAALAAMRLLDPPSGRRMMLVLSGGWVEPRANFPLAAMANRFGYTLYPVDVQGIDRVYGMVNDVRQTSPGGSGGLVNSPWKQVVNDGLELMAKLTGGKAMLNSARLSALERVVADTGSYYWLGFSPQWKGDDRYHRIVVKARQKGLAVRFRRGFWDLSHATEASLVAPGSLLMSAEAKDRQLVIETGAAAPEGATMSLPVTIVIPTAALAAVQQADGWLVQGTLALSVIDKGGAASDLVELPLKLTLPAKPGPDDHARYPATLKLRSVQQRLVATVRDARGNAVLRGEVQVAP